MSYELAQRAYQYAGEDRSWLLPTEDAPANRSVTLSSDLFTGANYPIDLIGWSGSGGAGTRVPSGTLLGIVTATGLAGPYNPAATDGTQTPVGLLVNVEEVAPGTARRIVAAVVTRGVVLTNRLWAGSGYAGNAAAVAAALPLVQFRTI